MAKSSSSSASLLATVNQLETTLNQYFAVKAPALPSGIKEFIVKIVPYLVILGVVLTIPAVLTLLGLGAVSAPYMMWGRDWGWWGWISVAFMVVILVIEVMAIPGLFKHQKSAWDKLFWVSLISLAQQLIGFNLIGMVISAVIGWYFLFQIRSYYR